MTVLTMTAAPERPRRTRLQMLAFRRAQAIRHGYGNQPWVRQIETELAQAELLAAVDRYRSRAGNARTDFARRVHRRLTTGVL